MKEEEESLLTLLVPWPLYYPIPNLNYPNQVLKDMWDDMIYYSLHDLALFI